MENENNIAQENAVVHTQQDVAWFFALDELDKKLNEKQRLLII